MSAPASRDSSWYFAVEQDVALSIGARFWTPDEVQSALDAHDRGDFSMSAQLSRDFGRDKRIPGIRASIVNGFVGRSGVPLTFEPSKRGDQRRTQTIADQVEQRWWDWLPEDVQSRLVEDFVDLGLAVARVEVEASETEWAPRVTPWPMEHVRWNETLRRLETRDRDGNLLVITPGEGWLVLGSIRARSWLRGAVRPVGMALVERACVTRAWLRWCEKHGNPLLAIREPPTGNDKEKRAEKEAFYKRLQVMASNGIIRLPKGSDEKSNWDAEFIEADAGGWQGCKALIDKTDTDIAVAYTGQNLSTEVQGGSFAATTAHMLVRADFLAAVAETLSTCARLQLICWWGRANVEGWTDSLAPWPTYQTTPPETPEAKAKRQTDRLARAERYAAWLGDVDWVAMAEDDADIKLRSRNLLERPAPPTPPATAPPGTSASAAPANPASPTEQSTA